MVTSKFSLLFRGWRSRYPLTRKLGGPQSRCGRFVYHSFNACLKYVWRVATRFICELSGFRSGKGKKDKVFLAQPMKACKRNRGITPLILNNSTKLKCVVNVTLRPLYSSEKEPGTNWKGRWVGLIAGLDVLETRNVKSLWKRCTLYNAHHHGMFVVGSVVHWRVAGTSAVEDAAAVGFDTQVSSGLVCDLLAGCYRYGNEPPVFRICWLAACEGLFIHSLRCCSLQLSRYVMLLPQLHVM